MTAGDLTWNSGKLMYPPIYIPNTLNPIFNRITERHKDDFPVTVSHSKSNTFRGIAAPAHTIPGTKIIIIFPSVSSFDVRFPNE